MRFLVPMLCLVQGETNQEWLAPSAQQTSPPAVADALSLIGPRSAGHVSSIWSGDGHALPDRRLSKMSISAIWPLTSLWPASCLPEVELRWRRLWTFALPLWSPNCFNVHSGSVGLHTPTLRPMDILSQGSPTLCTPAPGRPLRPHELPAGLF